MTESLGKAVLELEANLGPFAANMREANKQSDSLQHALDAVAAVARVSEIELKKVRMDAAQGASSAAIADRIERSVGSVGKAAMEASAKLEQVKIGAAQAVESRIAADQITNSLQKVERQALKTRAATGGDGGASGRSGVGVGPFGSGFGRIGVLGAAVGGAALLGPAAAPGALGLLAAIPAFAAAGAGALGTLALAFDGVGKAIGGDLKAFKSLEPAQQQFVLTARSLEGTLDKLKQTAGAALFPGLTAGLKSALSPGTMAAITTAVTEFGHAIGQAGAAWGKYFGSAEFQSIFGPLMAAGARNLGTLSDAAMRLFDAFAVLGRAAIPLVEWMVKGVDAGARWVDAFVHAKDATGGLSGAMAEAKTSLQLIGGLLEALVRAVYELGKALYPVSKVAVKDLTDGLNALAGIIDRNKQTIRDVVSGALAALVQTVKLAAPIVGALAKALDAVAKAVGGWKVAFEIVLGGLLVKALFGVATQVANVGIAATGATTEITAMRLAMIALSNPAVLVSLATVAAALAALYTIKTGGPDNLPTNTGGLPKNIGGHKVIGGGSRGVVGIDLGGGMAIQYDQSTRKWSTYSHHGVVTSDPVGVSAKKAAALLGVTPAALAATPGIARPAGSSQWGAPAGLGSASGGTLGLRQLEDLWVQAGGSRKLAATMAAIALAESGGKISNLNDNPSTGDYSAGLWQINYFGKMMKSRTAQFGSPALLRSDPLANARAAVALAGGGAGLGNWSTYKSGAYLANFPAGAMPYSPPAGSPFGAQPPWTKNLGATPPAFALPPQLQLALAKAGASTTSKDDIAALRQAITWIRGNLAGLSTDQAIQAWTELGALKGQLAGLKTPAKTTVIPASVTHLLNLASANQTSAGTLGNVGVTARRFLENELADLNAADRRLDTALKTATGKARTQLDTALTRVENKIKRVQALINDAIVVTGDALLPEKLKSKMAGLSAKFTADSDYAAVLVGQGAADYQAVLKKNLLQQTTVLAAETASLKTRLLASAGKQKTAIAAEMATVAAQLQQVQQQVLGSLEGTVQTLQGKVATAFQTVTAKLDAAFEAKTQSMVDALGVKFFQGAQTPAEQALADAQRAQTQEQLQQALDDARKAVDAATNASLVYDSSTGMTTSNVRHPALLAAQKQLAAAEEAIRQDKLQAQATKERTAADAGYAAAVKQTTLERAAEESDMNDKLALLGDAFQNGTGSMADLTVIMEQYGVSVADLIALSGGYGAQIATTIPAFGNLSSAAGALYTALQNLASYIATVTGVTPDLPAGTGDPNSGGGDSYTLAQVDAINATYAAVGILGRVTASGGGAYFQSHIGKYGSKPIPMAGGGMGSVSIPTLFLAGEAGKEDYAFSGAGRRFGGLGSSTRGDLHVHVSGVVGNEAEVAQRIAQEVQKLNRRGMRFNLK